MLKTRYLLWVRDVARIGQDEGAELVEVLHGPAPLVAGGVLLPANQKGACSKADSCRWNQRDRPGKLELVLLPATQKPAARFTNTQTR